MTELERVKKWGVVDRFLERIGVTPGRGVSILENPTEELVHGLARGKRAKLHSMGRDVRIEENYLYSTRRFPSNTANNTIGAGAVAAGDYPYFSFGLGDAGTQAGYFSVGNLTLQQTNMAAGGKIPSGRAFQMYDLGISFNAQAVGGDIAQCLDVMNLNFNKQNGALILNHGPIKFWPGGTGLYGYAATTVTTTTIQSASNGMPNLANVRRFRNPRVLESNEVFQYIITASAATPNANTTVALTAFVEVCIWLFGHYFDRNPQ